jgi:hypothetical protein
LFDGLKASWKLRKFGIQVGELTHVMFADDTTLLAGSRKQLAIMISEVKAVLLEHGLKLNASKCKIQTNDPNASLQPVRVDAEDVIPMVSASMGFAVLGTTFTLIGRTSAEIKSRIAAAWRKFHQLWPMLGRREADIHKRLKLFDATVGHTFLWCCETWNPTKTERKRFQSVQNDMLRRIAGPRRQPEQKWVDWIQASTRVARGHARRAKIRMWDEAHLQKKWAWAGHVCRMQPCALARSCTLWKGSAWWREEQLLPPAVQLHRPFRTRWFRWEDALAKFAERQSLGDWTSLAADRQKWSDLTASFVKFCR